MRRLVSVIALVLACGGLTAGCTGDASAGCASGDCHLSLSEGGSLTLDGQKLTVKRLDDDTVTFDSHGIDLTLSRSTDLSFGRYHLHFGGTDGSSVKIDVSQ
ncbi:hypothetical protein [Streptacidiphilus sp. P02-A3a]|uniref:hypothetical protein n=1 Tax=Streptacidiphilus sp. P02-A3a TaxID=2704468 RepID=UPI0015FD47F6|nr:hypothetical protein [Streptacidiphilus sp. P02-A3a]QMU70732.1 hypothetical protein GXP74_23495 [Streptacidiphilus sp. P02-A3a]